MEDNSYLWILEKITALNLRDAMASGNEELADSWADVLGMLLELRKKLFETGSVTDWYDVDADEWLPALARMLENKK